MTFRPTLWATLAAIVVLAILVGLGTWQLDRRAWKQQILETRAQRITAPAVDYSELREKNMARRVFFSLHYRYVFKVNQIRI